MHWSDLNFAVKLVGFMMLFALLAYLRNKPRATRMRIMLALGVASVGCFAAAYFVWWLVS
jgi:hypothetical protein